MSFYLSHLESRDSDVPCLHLPAHDQTTTNCSGAILRREDGHHGSLRTHAYPQQETGYEKLRPCLREAGANDRQQAKDGGEEDGTATTEVVVQRVREPATTVNPQSVCIRAVFSVDPLT